MAIALHEYRTEVACLWGKSLEIVSKSCSPAFWYGPALGWI